MFRTTAAVVLTALVISACAPTIAEKSPDVKSPDVDACTFLTSEEIGAYFPDNTAPTTGLAPTLSSDYGITRCVWGNPSQARSVALLFIQGNQVDVIARTSDKGEPVGQRETYVNKIGSSLCHLYVEAPPGLVGFQARQTKEFEDPCEAAADTLTTVLERL